MSRAKDLTGSRAGKLLLLERKRENNKTFYYCKCDCGNEKWIRADHINSKKNPVRSCGCLAKETLFKAKDISGERFGRLIAVNPTEERDRYNGSVIWECKCDCGNDNVKVSAGDLSGGGILSCGCLRKEYEIKHGKEIGALHVKTKIIEDTNIQVIGADKPSKANTSGYKGVLWDSERKKWKAEIIFKKKKYYLGRYNNKEDAIKARKEAEEKLHKKFLRTVIVRPNVSKVNSKKKNKGGRPIRNFENQKIGRLTVLKIVGKSENGYIWRCRCECGNIKDILSTSLITGNTLSCGCYQKEAAKKSLIEIRRKIQVDSTNLALIASNKLRSNNTSGVQGVYYNKQRKRWHSYIRCQGKNHFLGTYENFEDAVKARKEAEEKYFKPIIEKYINKED